MKSLDELKNYYEVAMVPQLMKLDEKRKKIRVRIIIVDIFILLLTLVAGSLVFIYIPKDVICMVVICIPIAFAGFALHFINLAININCSGYYDEFKKLVIEKVIAFMGENFIYKPEGFIDKSDFTESGIFRDKPHPETYRGDDLVSSDIGDAKLAFSELYATYTTRGRSSQTHTIFKGLFFVVQFPGRFKDNIIVTKKPDGFPGSYLPPASLETLNNMGNRQVSVSFQGNKMFIAISFTEDLFEPDMGESLLKYQTISDYYMYLKFAVETVEGLIKDAGIWEPGELPAIPAQAQQIPYGISGGQPQEYQEKSSFYKGLCPACGTAISEETEFCINCGYKLN